MVIDVTEETSLQALYRLAQEEPCMHPMPCFHGYLVGICQFVAPFKPMSGGRSYCVAELRECQESRRGKKVQVLGVFCLGKCSKEGSLKRYSSQESYRVLLNTITRPKCPLQNAFCYQHSFVCEPTPPSRKQSVVLGLVASL